MNRWHDRLAAIGLSTDALPIATRYFGDVETHFVRSFGATDRARAWWIPGRIEVLGKHTDYGGGRSLLCAVERGFHVVASPREDALVHVVDASTRAALTIQLSPDAEPHPGHWTDYPISVIRRIGRDFPGATRGMNAVIRSSLPSASGLSSSSALVIATFLPLAVFNGLRERNEWRVIGNDDRLAEYLGAVENGRSFGSFAADRGVGTQGGSEDQTAILRSRPGQLLQYHFVPVTAEAVLPLPRGWCFVVAMSGVHAAKGAAVKSRYNALAAEVAALTALWRDSTGTTETSLLAALLSSEDALQRLDQIIAASGRLDADSLRRRLAQFADESLTIIPRVADAFRAGEMAAVGAPVARSQQWAADTLRNQIAETTYLARTAPEHGAAAASAFGAGFGGSVWALVRRVDAARFLVHWRNDYAAAFPQRRQRAEFFISHAGPPATEL